MKQLYSKWYERIQNVHYLHKFGGEVWKSCLRVHWAYTLQPPCHLINASIIGHTRDWIFLFTSPSLPPGSYDDTSIIAEYIGLKSDGGEC